MSLNLNCWYFYIFLLFLLATHGESCGSRTKKPFNSVLLPINYTISDNPSIISLRINGKHFCTGAIVSTTHILTSASCVCYLKKNEIENLKIVIGVSTNLEKGTELTAKNISCHPSKRDHAGGVYQTDLIDIAFVEAKEGILFGPTHSIAKLPFFHKAPTSTDFCYFMGWNSFEQNASTVVLPLQVMYVTVLQPKNCRDIMSDTHDERFIDNYYKCVMKEQFAFDHLQDPRPAVETYTWMEYGAPFFCDDMLLGVMHLDYELTNYKRHDKSLYTVTRIAPLYQYFKDVIPEYTPIEA